MKLRSSIKPGFDSAIRNILFCPPVGYPDAFKLESGAVELMALVGITDDEAQYARENDGEKLVELLARAGAFPVTDPAHESVISTVTITESFPPGANKLSQRARRSRLSILTRAP